LSIPISEEVTATVHRDGESWRVQIDTPGDERELKVLINTGVAFDDFPDFAFDPGWRACPSCKPNPRHRHAIYYCAWCGTKLPDYEEEGL
jgi:hypothetical protein